jgi:SSS family solute:Na+ symporter
MGLIGAAKWRSMNVTTISEMFGQYYNPSARVIAVIIQFLIVMTTCCLQFVAGGALLSAMLPQYFTMFSGSLLTAVVFVAITWMGGLWAGGLANLVNVIVIWLGVVVGFIAVWTLAGGSAAISAKLPTNLDYFSLTEGLGLSLIVAWFIVFLFTTFSHQAVIQVGFAAKTPKASKWGYILGGIIMAPLGFFAAYIGIAAKAMYPEIQSVTALPTMIMQTNPWVAGLTLAGLWAADISTGTALLTSSATLIQKDIYEWYLEGKGRVIDQVKSVRLSRALVLILGVLGFFMALQLTSIIKTLVFVLSLCGPFTIIFLFTVFAPGFCKKESAFWTILVGLIAAGIWAFVPEFAKFWQGMGFVHPAYMELIITVPLFVVLNLIFKERINTVGTMVDTPKMTGKTMKPAMQGGGGN